MKNVFKYTAIAAALAVSGSAAAGDLTTSTTVISSEYVAAQTATDTVTVTQLDYELGASYAVGDLLTINHPDIAVTGVTTFPQSANSANATFGLISSTATSHTYRVTAINNNANTTGETVSFGPISTTYAKLAGVSDVTFSVSSTLSDGSTVIDNSGDRSSTAVYVRSQVGASQVADKFEKVIDVGSERTLFADETNFDSAAVTFDIREGGECGVYYTDAAGNLQCLNFDLALPVGDFTPVASIGAMLEIDAEGNGVGITASNSDEIAYADGVVDITYDAGTTNSTINFINTTGDAATTLAPQQFTYSAAVNYGVSSSKTVASNLSLGAWTLNGAEVVVPLMPYGSGITQFFYVSNKSTQDGDVYVTAIDDDGESYELGMIGTASAGTNNNMNAALRSALETAGAPTWSGRFSLVITVNAPTNDVEVFAGYNSRGDRVAVDAIKKN